MIENIRAIIFDCEGVVIDTDSIWAKTQNKLIERRGHLHDHDELREILTGVPAEHAIGMLKKHCMMYETQEELEEEQEELLLNYLENELDHIPGFEEFHKLVEEDFELAMVTSLKGTALAKVIEKMRLLEFFDENIFSYEQVRNYKPQPDLFLLASEKMGLRPDECIVIEDSPKGIRAAKKAGMQCIAITTSFNRKILEAENPDFIIDKFEELDLENL